MWFKKNNSVRTELGHALCTYMQRNVTPSRSTKWGVLYLVVLRHASFCTRFLASGHVDALNVRLGTTLESKEFWRYFLEFSLDGLVCDALYEPSEDMCTTKKHRNSIHLLMFPVNLPNFQGRYDYAEDWCQWLIFNVYYEGFK